MNLVLQPPGSFCCGQCCVAMITGITRKEAVKKFGTKGSTTTKAVRRALLKLGYGAGERLKTFRREASLPGLCMLVLKYENRASGHWVVYCDGLIYCPGRGIYPFAELAAAPGTTCTSYLSINPL